MPWIKKPVLRLGDTDFFVLTKDCSWQSPASGEVYTVPKGFKTNFASVPRFLRWYVNRSGASRLPAIIHDYHYGSGMNRHLADCLFLEGLKEQGMRITKAKLLYYTLRLFGWTHYEAP